MQTELKSPKQKYAEKLKDPRMLLDLLEIGRNRNWDGTLDKLVERLYRGEDI